MKRENSNSAYGGKENMYRLAEKRAAAKIGWFIHLAVYIVVNGLLVTINVTTSPQYYWFKWPLLGWGLGLGFHALGVFAFSGGSQIRDWMVRKELEKLNRK